MKRRRRILFQAREPHDPMRHQEVQCFAETIGEEVGVFEVYNLITTPTDDVRRVIEDESVMLFIGGSGDYSISTGGPPLLERFVERVIPEIIASERPTFGSCWGYHALVAGGGGRVERTGDVEIGTYPVRVARPHGAEDPLLSEHDEFHAQMGHKDWVLELPGGAVSLCENDLSKFQGARFGSGPVYGLQFHPELSVHRNRERFNHYLEHYSKGANDPEMQSILSRFRDSPRASHILRRFSELFDLLEL